VKIAITTGGGDAPGLNAVIRGAVLSAIHRGWECLGIRRGYGGLLGDDRIVPLGARTRYECVLDGGLEVVIEIATVVGPTVARASGDVLYVSPNHARSLLSGGVA